MSNELLALSFTLFLAQASRAVAWPLLKNLFYILPILKKGTNISFMNLWQDKSRPAPKKTSADYTEV